MLLGDGAGGFRSSLNFRAIDSPDSIIAADFTGDGKLDLAAATFLLGPRVAILQGRGDGSSARPGSSRSPARCSTSRPGI